MNIVITGSSTGIGRAATKRFLQNGHQVWGLARFNQAQFVADNNGNFFASRCDVSEWAELERSASDVAATWPHVDALITCAGQQGEIGPAVSRDPIRWSATVRVNLDGTFFSIRAFYNQLIRAPRRAKIVCISGGGATKARPNFSAYGAAKTAVVRLVETIAAELDGMPIDVNVVAPGAINTRLTDEVIALGPTVVGQKEFETALTQKSSGGDSIEGAVDLLEWLISPESDGISGRLISAVWDPWQTLGSSAAELAGSDSYTLRRTLPMKPNSV